MFTLTVIDILLSKGRSVLSPAQRGTGTKSVKTHFNVLKLKNDIAKTKYNTILFH